MSDSAPPVNVPTLLPQRLGFWDAVAVVVGSIIGSGVFLKAATVARNLPAFATILFVWFAVGLVTLCGSLAVGELSAMFPRAGGPYLYLKEAYGRWSAFLWGWTEFWVIRTGSVGALSCATVIYLARIIFTVTGHQLTLIEQGTLTGFIVVALTAVNIIGVRWGAAVQNVTVVIKIGFLIAIVVLPCLLMKADVTKLAPVMPAEMDGNLLRGLGVAMIAVLWAYDGWINVSPLAEEIRDPGRNLPRALLAGSLVVMAVYLGANTSYHLVLTHSEVANSGGVVADFFRVLTGDAGAIIAAAGVMCSTFGAVNSNLLTGPRIFFAMARDGLLPRSMSLVSARFATPANAILAQGTWTMVLVISVYLIVYVASLWSRTVPNPLHVFDLLTDFVIFGGSIFYGMAVGAVFVLRFTRPDLPRPYRTWGYPFTPAIYLAAFVAALVSLLTANPVLSLAGLTVIAAGAIVYALFARPEDSRP